MDKQIQRLGPDYCKIYNDIIDLKYPHKKESCESILQKKQLSALDIIMINRIIFNNTDKNTFEFNQKSKSYTNDDIIYILNYQKENSLNNTQTALHFKLSRNSITKWKKIFR